MRRLREHEDFHPSVWVRLGERSARWAHALVPDPFVLALVLAGVGFLIALLVGAGPAEMARSFATGMLEPGLLAFGFQMALILLTGHALAETPSIRGLLEGLAGRARTTAGAATLVAGTAMAMGLLNWGLGLVAGAFLAREVGRSFERRGDPLNYPLVGAAGYTGLLVWHGGLSGSAPLTVASPTGFGAPIPVTETLFSPLNLVITAGVVTVSLLVFRLLGRGGAVEEVKPPKAPVEVDPEEGLGSGIAGALGRSRVVTAFFVVPVSIALGFALWDRGASGITLEWVILVFWTAGMLLHHRPAAYARAFGSGAAGAGGILLQFPIYFGVMAVMRDSGAMALLARAFADLATSMESLIPPGITASVGTFFSAALINLFVPSGGGQWKLQAPLILETAQVLNLDRAPLVMAFAYGDQLTNMLQPFWALPLLSITGLRARHLMGYTLLVMLAAIPVIVAGLVLL